MFKGAAQGTGISEFTRNNRTVIKTFTAYELFELLIGWMGHVRLNVVQINRLLHFFLCEHAKLLADSLDHHKGVVVATNIQVWHSLPYTDIFLKKESLTFWSGDNPITFGVVVNNISILLKLRNGKQVCNNLLIELELP